MTNELLKPVADALTAPTAVGSGNLLGCVFLEIALIIDMVCLVGLGVILYKMTSEENQYRRQHDQHRRKNRHNPSEPNNATRINLGIFGKPDVEGNPASLDVANTAGLQLTKMNKLLNVTRRCLTKPLNRLLLISAIRRFFGYHKNNGALTQPNAKAEAPATGGFREPKS